MARYRNVVTGAIVNVPEEKGERLDGYVPADATPKKTPAAKKAPAKKAPAKTPATKPAAKATGSAPAKPEPKADGTKSPADES